MAQTIVRVRVCDSGLPARAIRCKRGCDPTSARLTYPRRRPENVPGFAITIGRPHRAAEQRVIQPVAYGATRTRRELNMLSTAGRSARGDPAYKLAYERQ